MFAILKYRSLASLPRFIPRYFTFFVVVVNGIGSLISLSDLLLLVHSATLVVLSLSCV